MPAPKSDRNAEIGRQYAEGASVASLAVQYGISKQRVWMIVKPEKQQSILQRRVDRQRAQRTAEMQVDECRTVAEYAYQCGASIVTPEIIERFTQHARRRLEEFIAPR